MGQNDVWCNGSTTDFGSVSGGSSPPTLTMYYLKKKKTDKPKKRQASQATLVKKLDKVFSQYIRLRDAFPNGTFRCISCGKIKPFDQSDCGHYHSRRHMSTRFDEENCNSECRYCLTPDALILTSDLRWKPLGNIEVGQKIFAFDEDNSHQSQPRRSWRLGEVTHVHRDIQEVYDVELENGDHIKTTGDHRWLVKSRNNYEWVATKNMWIHGVNIQGKHKTGPHTEKTTTIVCKPFNVIQHEKTYESGWLAGMIDADGHICQQNIHNADGSMRYGFRIGVAQSEKYPDLCHEIVRLMEKFTGNNKPCRQWMEKKDVPEKGIKCRYQTWQFLITGTNIEKLHFLMRIRPKKMSKIDVDKLGMIRSKYNTKVKSITPLGKQEIVVMETSTHTFVANGYMMHNCNRFSADHLIGYRANLIRKIGTQRYQLLEAKAHQTKKWSCFELEQLIKYYSVLVKKLSDEKGIRI